MNCAAVTVTNGGSGLTGPTPFVANANVNECKTIENIDVVFPDPGSVVHYGGSYASTRPTTPAGYVGSNCVGPGASASPSGSAKASSSAIPSKTSAQPTTTAAASTPVVNEHVVSTSTVLTSAGDVTTSTLQDSASSTGTASASAVTTTTTGTSGKVSPVFTSTSRVHAYQCLCRPSSKSADERQSEVWKSGVREWLEVMVLLGLGSGNTQSTLPTYVLPNC